MLTSRAPGQVQRADESAGDGVRRAEFERRRQERITATGDAAAITLAFGLVMSFTGSTAASSSTPSPPGPSAS